MELYTKIEIQATADRVWQHLTNLDDFHLWNPFILSAQEPHQTLIDKLDLQQFYTLPIPKSYLYCMEDTSRPQQGEWDYLSMSRRLGLFRFVQMPGSHEVMFSNPVGLAENIVVAGRD